MVTSDEMYQLGVRDAENDDLNLFYYQHYYYYRQGYDQARRSAQKAQKAASGEKVSVLPSVQRMMPFLSGLVIVVLLVAVLVLAMRGPGESSSPAVVPTPVPATPQARVVEEQQVPTTEQVQEETEPLPTATAVLLVVPTTAAPAQRPTPTVQEEETGLHVGGWAVVANLGQAPLRARSNPGVEGVVQLYLRDGDEVKIIDGPVKADGYTWWRVQGEDGKGWCAETSASGIVWLQPTNTGE